MFDGSLLGVGLPHTTCGRIHHGKCNKFIARGNSIGTESECRHVMQSKVDRQIGLVGICSYLLGCKH